MRPMFPCCSPQSRVAPIGSSHTTPNISRLSWRGAPAYGLRRFGIKISPSPIRSTATGAPVSNPNSWRYSLGIVSWPFSPIRVWTTYSTCNSLADIVRISHHIDFRLQRLGCLTVLGMAPRKALAGDLYDDESPLSLSTRPPARARNATARPHLWENGIWPS